MSEIEPESRGPEAAEPTPDDADVEQAIADAQASLHEVQDAIVDVDESLGTVTEGVSEAASQADVGGIELLSDVDMHVMIELGRTQMLVEDVLKLDEGSVVELDKLAGDPVDVYVNQRLIARGEVLVLNDNFCIRVSEIVADLETQAEAAAQEHAEPR